MFKQKYYYFLFIFLASISPFLSFTNKNFGELYFFDLVYISIYSLIIFFFSYFIFFFIQKKIVKENYNFYLVFCYLILLFFNFHIISSFINNLNILNFFNLRILSHIVWLIIFLLSFFVLNNLKKSYLFESFSKIFLIFINLVPFVFILYQSINIDRSLFKKNNENINYNFENIDRNNLTNVYYILFDHYSRADVYKKFYNLDNSYFLNEIEKYNYKVLKNSATNITWTDLVMTSIFEMNLDVVKTYLKNNDSYEIGNWKIGETKVQKIFKSAGYKHFVSLENTMHGTPCRRVNLVSINIDKCISQKIKLAELEFNLLKMTPLFDILGKFFPNFFTYAFLYPDFVTKKLHSIIPKNEKIFYYLHFYMPHPPPKFGENCKKELQILEIEGDGQYDKYLSDEARRLIKRDVECLNSQILNFVETLNKLDPESIVVIQGDNSNVPKIFPFSHYILNIWKLPNRCKNMIKDEFTNVNTFRIIFNCLGLGNWELQKNELIDSKYNRVNDVSNEFKVFNLTDEKLKFIENKFQ